MTLSIKSISDVTEYQLCSGCGVCAYVEPDRFRMGNSLEFGRRPFLKEGAAPESFEALGACPGASLKHLSAEADGPGRLSHLQDAWGPIYAVWEGYAADPNIRHGGSSGGAATALAAFCLEKRGAVGVLHTAASEDDPVLNRTVMSRTRDELIERTGSRYSPASPGEGLQLIEQAEGPCVFIGKPCDVAGVQQARRIRPKLDRNLALTIAFFCAGTPSTKGTLELMHKVGVRDNDHVLSLRYRGNGWPGMWSIRATDNLGVEQVRELTYAESWGFLQKYRQWRCYICPDHTGEFADVAVGDPWYRDVQTGEVGKSLIVARTERGLEIIKAAAAAGYFVLEKCDPTLLPRSQPELLGARGALWARISVLRLLGAAVPQYFGFATFRFWLTSLSFKAKIQAFTGTAKRLFTKKLTKRMAITEWVGRPKK